MNCKTISATRTTPFSATILRITVCLCFIGASSFAHAANITWSGQLKDIQEDSGDAIYSGVAVGTDFSGAISDVTFSGFITDGTTRTSLRCCISGTVGLEVTNNEPLEAEDATLLNSLAGTSFVGGDSIDFILLEAGESTSGGGVILFELVFVLDADTFDDDSLDNYPPDPDDVLITLFLIEEEDNQGETIYESLGVVDEINFAEDVFQINPGLNGAWFNTATAGQGFLLEVFPDIPLVFLAWFTYDTVLPGQDDTAQVGYPGHRWLTAQGGFEGDTANLNVFLTTGGLFDDPTPVNNTPEGTITLTFEDCTAGTVDYNFLAAGVSGSIPISRLANDNVSLCESLGINASALLVAPYVKENEMMRIDPFSFSNDSVTGLFHDGIDFHVTTDLSEFQAACSGEVDMIDLFQNGELWQVNVRVLCDDRYSIGYGFEPFTAVQQDGETQLDNIAVTLGQTVSQGDIIGRLHRADEENAHIHFALWENFEPICPDQFFTSEAKESILRLIHMDHSDWNICN